MSRIQHPISLADWRRLVVKLYAAVRASDDPELAWRGWREERDRLFREHPQAPVSRGIPPVSRARSAIRPHPSTVSLRQAPFDRLRVRLRRAPFADATSGRETHGGGRLLPDTIKGADLGMQGGRIVLDFNFAYYPSPTIRPARTRGVGAVRSRPLKTGSRPPSAPEKGPEKGPEKKGQRKDRRKGRQRLIFVR